MGTIGTAQRDTVLHGAGRACATAESPERMLAGVAASLRRAVPHAAAAWLTTDPASSLFNHGHIEAFPSDACAPWFHGELLVDDVHLFRDIAGSGARTLVAVEDRSDSWRWRELMRPQGLDHELRMTCDDGTGTWAAVELHREVGEPDFSPDEVALVEQLRPLVVAGARRLAVRDHAVQASDGAGHGPGVLLVHPDGDVEPLTAAGRAWGELLPPPSGSIRRTAMLAMAGVARAVASGREPALAAARVRTRTLDGRWVTLHAQPGLRDDAVVVVVEPSHPAEVAAVLARAHGLTPREQEVVLAVSRGSSTRRIAEELFLSQHTVRDHVKSAMAKVGVSSRGQLVAALFEQHHAPGLHATVSVAD